MLLRKQFSGILRESYKRNTTGSIDGSNKLCKRNYTGTGATHWPKLDANVECPPGQCVAPV